MSIHHDQIELAKYLHKLHPGRLDEGKIEIIAAKTPDQLKADKRSGIYSIKSKKLAVVDSALEWHEERATSAQRREDVDLKGDANTLARTANRIGVWRLAIATAAVIAGIVIFLVRDVFEPDPIPAEPTPQEKAPEGA